MLTKRGFYGEAIPADSGLTVVIKSHGHTTGKAADLERKEQVRNIKMGWIYAHDFHLVMQMLHFLAPLSCSNFKTE